MTFSLAARCRRTGMFGVIVSSSSPAVAARCAYARAGVGAACTQNVTDPRLGPRMLDLLAQGLSAPQAIRTAIDSAHFPEFRQLSVVDSSGQTASYSGPMTLGDYRTVESQDAVAAGNLLASPNVPKKMIEGFTWASDKPLGDRLIAALIGGMEAGGELGAVHSAGLILVDKVAWHVADLRVDWSDDPIGELARLWEIWKPQMADYVIRALDPSQAPSYNVPGDETEID